MRGGLLLFASALYAQTAPGPRFEVASIKPALSPQERGYARPTGEARNAARLQTDSSLWGLIRQAYRLEAYQNLVGPDWMKDAWFEVIAKLPDGSNKDQIPEMLQTLLTDRFRLVMHWESKAEPVYLLTVGKEGQRLTLAESDATRTQVQGQLGGRKVISAAYGTDGWMVYSRLNGQIVMDSNRITMALLARTLRLGVGLPVIDRTGLTGAYQVTAMPVPATIAIPGKAISDSSSTQASDPDGVDIFKSVERLGLHLEKGKAPINHLVIEHVEKVPIGN